MGPFSSGMSVVVWDKIMLLSENPHLDLVANVATFSRLNCLKPLRSTRSSISRRGRVPVRLDLQLGPTTKFFGEAPHPESRRKEPWPTTLSAGPNMADVARPTTRPGSAARCKSCARSWSWGEKSRWPRSGTATETLTDCVPDWGRRLWKVSVSGPLQASELKL